MVTLLLNRGAATSAQDHGGKRKIIDHFTQMLFLCEDFTILQPLSSSKLRLCEVPMV